jgi:hypothetical protein
MKKLVTLFLLALMLVPINAGVIKTVELLSTALSDNPSQLVPPISSKDIPNHLKTRKAKTIPAQLNNNSTKGKSSIEHNESSNELTTQHDTSKSCLDYTTTPNKIEDQLVASYTEPVYIDLEKDQPSQPKQVNTSAIIIEVIAIIIIAIIIYYLWRHYRKTTAKKE